MMMFRVLKKNLVTILDRSARGRFVVVGHPNQTTGTGELLKAKRRVQVFFGNGDFSKGNAGPTGPVQHEITYQVTLSLTAQAEGNLAAMNTEGDDSTARAVRKAAIAQFYTAATMADQDMDEFLEQVYQVLMDGRNVDIDTDGPPYLVSNRWVESIDRFEPISQGDTVIITATINYTCQAVEEILGDIGTAAAQPAFNITDDINENGSNNTGSLTGEDPEE